MANKASNILNKTVTLLTGLAITGQNVTKGRTYNIEANVLPHLSIYRGSNRPVEPEDQNMSFSDWRLTVRVMITVKSVTQDLDDLMGDIESEIVQAMKADHTLGLSYVQNTIELGAAEPVTDGQGEQPTAEMELSFDIKYRRSITDPGS